MESSLTSEELDQIRKETDDIKSRLPLPWVLWNGRKEQIRAVPPQPQKLENGAKLPDGTELAPGSIIMIPGKTLTIPARCDIYSGPGVDENTPMNKLKELGAKQVCHFHPEAPQIYEQSDQTEYSMPYLAKSCDRIDRLLLLVQELKEKITYGTNHG